VKSGIKRDDPAPSRHPPNAMTSSRIPGRYFRLFLNP
jgi:hypothetical protein